MTAASPRDWLDPAAARVSYCLIPEGNRSTAHAYSFLGPSMTTSAAAPTLVCKRAAMNRR
jgi:hypothetical protein